MCRSLGGGISGFHILMMRQPVQTIPDRRDMAVQLSQICCPGFGHNEIPIPVAHLSWLLQGHELDWPHAPGRPAGGLLNVLKHVMP